MLARLSLALLCGLLCTDISCAEPLLRLVPLKGQLYVIEDDFYARENSMLYIGPDHITVIGATWTPATARLLVDEIKKISDKPVTEVINTVHDLDRTGGNAYFREIGAKIIATQSIRDLLAKEGSDQITETRKFAADYPEIPIVLPDTIVGDDFTLQEGGIRGLWLGPSHKPDDIFIYFPNEKVLYGGCVLKPKLGNLNGADLAGYPKALNRLKALKLPIEIIIAGHYSAVHGPDLIDRYLELLAQARK
jgi:metallo-beta-lactamase class B